VMIELSMGPDFERTVAELSGMGKALVEAAGKGLEKGVKIAAGRVVKDYLSGQALKRRTGQLARSVDGWMAGPLEGVVGVQSRSGTSKYAWLLGGQTKMITPKRAKFLTIPVGENLTGSGVARFSSPRQVPEGFFVRTKGSLLFGHKRGKKGKFRALFALVKSVTIEGSNALYDGVTESLDEIAKVMESQIARQTGAR